MRRTFPLLIGASRNTPPVYRLRATEQTDSYGDLVADDWNDPSRVVLNRAELQSPASTETEGATGTTNSSERVLFVLGTPDLLSTDRIEVDGEVWRVDGTPRVRRGLATTVYTTAKLIRSATS
jgi:hypothetical protein